MTLEEWVDKINAEGWWLDMSQGLHNESGEYTSCWRVRIFKYTPAGIEKIDSTKLPPVGFATTNNLVEAIEAAYCVLKLEEGTVKLRSTAKPILPKVKGTTMSKETVNQMLLELGL